MGRTQLSLVRAIVTILVCVVGTSACLFDDSPLRIGTDYRNAVLGPDGGVGADASMDAAMARSMDASVDAQLDASEMDARVDANELDASDLDAPMRRWISRSLGAGDSDDANPFLFGMYNEMHVVAVLESMGRLNYLYRDGAGGWAQQYIDNPPGDGERRSGCPSHPTMAIDSLGAAHVVFLVASGVDAPCTGTETPNQLLHAVANTTRGGYADSIGSAHVSMGPPSLLIEGDMLHVVHRSDGNLVYFWYRTSTERTAGTLIPSTDGVESATLFRRTTGDLFIVYARDGTLYHQTLHGESWSTPVSIGDAGITSSSSYDATHDLLHVVQQRVDALHYDVLSLDAGIVRSENIVRAHLCDTLALAVDSHSDAILACGRSDIGVDVYTRIDGTGGWRAPEPIRPPPSDAAPIYATPTLHFDSDGVPHVVYVGTAERGLYLASPELASP